MPKKFAMTGLSAPAEERTHLTALVEFDEGWWSVRVPDLPGVRTHTSDPGTAEAAIREALAFAGDLDPSGFDIELVVVEHRG